MSHQGDFNASCSASILAGDLPVSAASTKRQGGGFSGLGLTRTLEVTGEHFKLIFQPPWQKSSKIKIWQILSRKDMKNGRCCHELLQTRGHGECRFPALSNRFPLGST